LPIEPSSNEIISHRLSHRLSPKNIYLLKQNCLFTPGSLGGGSAVTQTVGRANKSVNKSLLRRESSTIEQVKLRTTGHKELEKVKIKFTKFKRIATGLISSIDVELTPGDFMTFVYMFALAFVL
jgi:hypothetical protein